MAQYWKAKARSTVDADRRAVPVMKIAGDSLIEATLNTHGSLVMEAQKVGAETVLSQIVQMVARAQRSKAPLPSIRSTRL